MIAKVTMKALCSFIIALLCGVGSLSAAQQWKDTIVVARDGTGDYRTLTEAMEGIGWFGMMNLMRAHLLAMIGHTRFKEQGG